MPISNKPIEYFNRQSGEIEFESVYGGSLVSLLYETKGGQILADKILSRPWLSHYYGLYQDSPLSKYKIKKFIDEFKINMSEYEGREFGSFNDFFTRKFKLESRNFTRNQNSMAAFAEGRYLGFDKISPELRFPVKGGFLTAKALLGVGNLSGKLSNGPMLIARLCPVDYHRFHFPDDGKILETYRVEGSLHSVNPTALKFKGDIFATNERQISILETGSFGTLAYVEVGALCVGKIVQTHDSVSFKRGDEKGYFHFGASTVIVMGEPGRWKPSSDILENSQIGREVFIRLGDVIANL